MDEKILKNNKFDNKNKCIKINKSLIFPNKQNIQEKGLSEESDNNINININRPKKIISKSFNINIKDKKENHLLIIHKINIKDKKNTFYKQGVNDIFNDENIFLNNIYKNKRVIVGRNKPNTLKTNFLSNPYSKKKWAIIINIDFINQQQLKIILF